MMRVLICVVSLLLAACGGRPDPELMAEIEYRLAASIERGDVRAAAIGLYDHGQTRVIGLGRLSSDDPGTPQGDTLFEIGSITKVFTSLLTQTLVDKGTLAWDDTLADRLPDIEFASREVASITLGELASHTSGLPRIPDNMDPADPMNPYDGYERADLMAFLAAYAPDALVKEYAYSNLGAGVLGEIAADAAGHDFGSAMVQAVLQPLGMHASGVHLRADQANRLARGFSDGADMPNWSGFDALAGAGALMSTVDDLLQFVSHNFESEIMQQALDAIRVPQAGGETGFGWHILVTDDGDRTYWHNGGTGGYASFLAISPGNDTGVVILTTSTDYTGITEMGFSQITGEMVGGTVANLDAYPGAYRIAEGFVLTVMITGDRLAAQATGQSPFPLTPSAANEFVFPAADVRIVFDLDETGKAGSLTLYQGGKVMPAPRVADELGQQVRQEITLQETELREFVGEYQLSPAKIISIVAGDQQLYAQLTGQAAFPVFAYDRDRFFYKVVDAQLYFERGDDGAVIAVVLNQGGEQRAPRID